MSDIGSKENFSHDHFVKQCLSKPKVVREFFEAHIPSLVKNKVNLNTLKPIKDS